MIENRCPHCDTRLTSFLLGGASELSRSGHARHIKRCERSTPEQRDYYRQHGFWPLKPGSRKLTVLRVEPVAPRRSRPRMNRGPKP